MRIAFEKPEDSKDFGDKPTLKISSSDSREHFQLGILFMDLVNSKSEVVHGETDDSKGMMIRIPLTPSK